jgi:hypothetical protein
MRVLITGSRRWDDQAFIDIILNDMVQLRALTPVTLVSGACPTGADAICEMLAARKRWTIERHPADWDNLGKRAGFVRNAEMVKLGADLCLAFILNQSNGAMHTADLAVNAGIETYVYHKSD